MTQRLILFFSIISLLVSCENGNNGAVANSDQEPVYELIKRFPELAEDTVGGYQLVRTVIIGENKAGVKLYSCQHEYNTPNRILVISNSKGEQYPIPLFSNNYRKYWNFENEGKTFKSNRYNSLFEKEFLTAIDQLNLNDTLGTGHRVLFEIFHSLLHVQQVTEHDGDYLQDLGSHLVSSNSHTDEDRASQKRNELNCTQVINSVTTAEYRVSNEALLDTKNYRVFQLEFPTKRNEKITRLNIKTYRFGNEVQTFSL